MPHIFFLRINICNQKYDILEENNYASNLPIIQDGTTKIFVAQYDEENGEAFAYAVFSLTVENGKFATVDEAYIVDSIDEI